MPSLQLVSQPPLEGSLFLWQIPQGSEYLSSLSSWQANGIFELAKRAREGEQKEDHDLILKRLTYATSNASEHHELGYAFSTSSGSHLGKEREKEKERRERRESRRKKRQEERMEDN